MNENIRLTEIYADADGTLDRQAYGYFNLCNVADGENVRRLLVANLIREVENISAAWEGTEYKSVMTDKEILPPQYFGDSIRFYWSRPFSRPENRAKVDEESSAALQAAVDAVVKAGFSIMEYPEWDERVLS